MILTIRTDKSEAEIGLYDSHREINHETWTAHRELSNTLLLKIEELLEKSKITLSDIEGLVVFKGPGSFTGLRIGITTANTLAYSLSIPVVAQEGEEWISEGIKRIKAGVDEKISLPEYGGEANITKQKK